MKRSNVPEEDEAYILVENVTGLTESIVNGFVEHISKGHIEVSKESENFVATVKLERKKEGKR